MKCYLNNFIMIVLEKICIRYVVKNNIAYA